MNARPQPRYRVYFFSLVGIITLGLYFRGRSFDLYLLAIGFITIAIALITYILPFKRVFYTALFCLILTIPELNGWILGNSKIPQTSLFYVLFSIGLALEFLPVSWIHYVWPRLLSKGNGNNEEVRLLKACILKKNQEIEELKKPAKNVNLDHIRKSYERQINQLEEEINDLEGQLEEQSGSGNLDYEGALKLLNIKEADLTKKTLNSRFRVLRSAMHGDKFQGKTDTDGLFQAVLKAEQTIKSKRGWQ